MQKILGIERFLSKILMIQESCNLTGEEHILVNQLKGYVIHNKDRLFSLVFT